MSSETMANGVVGGEKGIDDGEANMEAEQRTGGAEMASPIRQQLPLVNIERQMYNQPDFFQRYPPMDKKKVALDERYHSVLEQTKQILKPSKEKCKSFLNLFLPCIPRMRHYQWRQWFVGDMVSGLTLGTIHIPQCLGYSAIVQVNPAFGLYSSFFPILIYFVFGTSHGISIGTVAVMSLLAGDFVTEQYPKYVGLFINNTTATADFSTSTATGTVTTAGLPVASAVFTSATTAETPPLNMDCTIAIAVTATFLIGCLQLALGTFQLGIIGTLMSTPFNSAYMTATAFVTALSQVPPALGLKLPQYPGLFTVPYQLRDIFINLPHANPADIIAALISIVWLLFIKEFINVKYRKKLPVPIPSELFVVIVGTGICYGANLNAKYNLKIVGNIPLGFPKPAAPALLTHIGGDFFVGCITMTIVACVECLTMAKILARKYRYHVDANQEFRAYGLVNFISSFFHVFPTAQSPPRTMIFDTTGGKTQVASLWAAGLVLIVIVGVGPLFQYLPKACLASIIIVAVIPLLKHVKELKFYWKVQKWDFVGWILTCLSVLVLDLAVGLGVGIGWNLLIILAQSVMVQGYTEESTNEPDIFLRSKAYYNTRDIEGIRIFRFESDLFFANAESFKNQLFNKTVNPHKLMLIRKRAVERGIPESSLRRRSTASKASTSPDINFNKNIADFADSSKRDGKFATLVKHKLSRSSNDVVKFDNSFPMNENEYAASSTAADMLSNGGYANQALEAVPTDNVEIPLDSTEPVKTVIDSQTEPRTQPLCTIQEQMTEEQARKISTTSDPSSYSRDPRVNTHPGSTQHTRYRTSAVSWHLPHLPHHHTARVDIEHTPLPDADFIAAGTLDDKALSAARYPARNRLRNSFSGFSHMHNADAESSAVTLRSFYRPSDLDFVAIDEDQEERQINEEVEEIRRDQNIPDGSNKKPIDINTIILDCSPIAYIDFNGLLIIRQLFEDYRDVEIRFLLGACGRFMLDKLKTSAIYEEFGQQIYPTVFDAVMAAQAEPAENFFTSSAH